MSQPPLSAEENWHALAVERVAESLRTDPKRGLTVAEAARRLQQHGPNRLEEAKRRSRLSIFIAQFQSLIVLLLAVATVVAFFVGDRLEGISILVVILLNALIGFLTESKAETAIAALKRQFAPTAQVLREGNETQLPVQEVVPGDVAVLTAGARVPADGRIVENINLQIQEASLTGESQAVNKTSDPLSDASLPLGDRTNMAYMSTTITDGRGLMLVTATGSNTEIGRIGKLIEEAQTETTPLEKQLAQLGRALIVIVLALCAVVAAVGYFRGFGWLAMFKVGISLAIAAVPEGLPAVATVALALGVQRMARQRVLIRHLAAVETLGSTTVICVDKTGTLTRNEMTVAALELDDRHVEVTGSGYDPKGDFQSGKEQIDPKSDATLNLALRIGALCNDAKIERKEDEPNVLGDPTEAALIVAAEKAGFNIADLQREEPRVGEVPFSSEAQRMATIHRSAENKIVAYIKGAPPVILERSTHQVVRGSAGPLGTEDRQKWLERNQQLAAAALRVLALGYRELPSEQFDESEIDHDLVFVGLVGMIDPLRPEAKEAIEKCRAAQIRIIMLTGDQPATAQEIARQLGLTDGNSGDVQKTVHANDLKDAPPEDWSRMVTDSNVFARVSPENKLRIVEALQKQHQIVAMTGDGVNDAPALKKADIGIAMGIKGTEVAKETADMIVTDDNFASIVGAVEQGRIVYRNIQKFIHYLFSCNLSEILAVFVAIVIGWPLPLGALQILWLNIITDIFPALALAIEPSSPGIISEPPRDPQKKMVDWRLGVLITWQGVMLATFVLTAFGLGLSWHGAEGAGLKKAVTIAFMTIALAQTFHVFNSRSPTESIFTRQLFTNAWLWAAVALCTLLQGAAVFVPGLQTVLQTTVPDGRDWLLIAGCSLAPILVIELVKALGRVKRAAS